MWKKKKQREKYMCLFPSPSISSLTFHSRAPQLPSR